jgi:predicted dinucleotide-binding enzyme
MKIAIIGTGPTGVNIGAALVGKEGIEVKYGSREPSGAKVLALLKVGGPWGCGMVSQTFCQWARDIF